MKLNADEPLTTTILDLFNLLGESFQKDQDEADVALIAAKEKSTGRIVPVIAIKKDGHVLPVAVLFSDTEEQDKYEPLKGTGYTDKDPQNQVKEIFRELLEGLANGKSTIEGVEQVNVAGKIGMLIKGSTKLNRSDKSDLLAKLLTAMLKQKSNGAVQ